MWTMIACISVISHTELIRVEQCDRHYDHDKQLGHLQISQSKHSEIAGQLSKGYLLTEV